MRPRIALSILAVLLSGCASQAPVDPGQGPSPIPAIPIETSSPSTGGAAPQPSPQPPVNAEPMVEAAVAELATTLGVPPSDVTVVRVEAIDWPDASLGCPLPGKMYAQVVTPGLRIELQAEGKTYVVHTDLESQIVLCTTDVGSALPTIPVVPGEIDDGQPWMPVN